MAFPPQLTHTLQRFVNSSKAGGLILIVATVAALALANSPFRAPIDAVWQSSIAGMRIAHWVNDGLMAVFFLLIGLELEREFHSGELATLRGAALPVIGALGGILIPALIHYALNGGTPTQSGIGIPMATDIAFALGILALLGNRVPASLKVFLAALAVIDDLVAIAVIALFYTAELSVGYLSAALTVFAAMFLLLNRRWRMQSLWPYLAGGALMWFLLLKSGVHATIGGVLLAFAIPFSARREDQASPSHRLEQALHVPVAFGVLPIFAFVNTGVPLGPHWASELLSLNSLGIMGGLALGKPLGILLFSMAGCRLKWCSLPPDLTWSHVAGAGMLGGIGFTMAIFIAGLAFPGATDLVDASKTAILLGSLVAGLAGYCWLRRFGTAP